MSKKCLSRNLSSSFQQTKQFVNEKEKISKLSLQEKRERYKCLSEYTQVDEIEVWSRYGKNLQRDTEFKDVLQGQFYNPNAKLNDKIGIYFGDITTLEIDSIVNSTNTDLALGFGVDGAIHMAAGIYLFEECQSLDGIEMGEAKITAGYDLPAKYVIHVVGPVEKNCSVLESCYKNSLQLAVKNNIKTIAFPCICTGIFRYPNKEAAQVALKTVRTFLESNGDDIDLIIFCLFTDIDQYLYRKLLPYYFPTA